MREDALPVRCPAQYRHVQDVAFAKREKVVGIERITVLGKAHGIDIAELEDEAEFSGGGILFRNSNTARGETTSHERLIHRMDELVDVAERQILTRIGAGDTFEKLESLHLVLNRDLRDVESDAFICRKIRRRRRGGNRLHTLLAKPLLPYLLLRPRLVKLLLLCRGGDSCADKEGEGGEGWDEE